MVVVVPWVDVALLGDFRGTCFLCLLVRYDVFRWLLAQR